MSWKDVLVVWLFLSTATISNCRNHGKLYGKLIWSNWINLGKQKLEFSLSFSSHFFFKFFTHIPLIWWHVFIHWLFSVLFVDHSLIKLIQRLSIEVKNIGAKVDLLLNQPSKFKDLSVSSGKVFIRWICSQFNVIISLKLYVSKK